MSRPEHVPANTNPEKSQKQIWNEIKTKKETKQKEKDKKLTVECLKMANAIQANLLKLV